VTEQTRTKATQFMIHELIFTGKFGTQSRERERGQSLKLYWPPRNGPNRINTVT
jgi:hypothetical protein